jgi:hypothetical protein
MRNPVCGKANFFWSSACPGPAPRLCCRRLGGGVDNADQAAWRVVATCAAPVRLTPLIKALIEAVTILLSMPTPYGRHYRRWRLR